MVDTYKGMADRVGDLADDMADGFEAATESSIDALQQDVRTNLIGQDAIATTELLRDIRQGRVESSSADSIVAEGVHVPRWARFVEHGTGARGRMDPSPGHEQYKSPDPMPPLSPILTWVRAKNIVARNPAYKDSPEDLAEAIRVSIGELGTKPNPFLRPAWYGTNGKAGITRANERALSSAVDSV